jgi:integrase
MRLDRLQRNPDALRLLLVDLKDHGGANGRALSPRTCVHVHRVLHTACAWARDDGKLASNPAAAPSVRKLARSYASTARDAFRPTCLKADEMVRLLDSMRDSWLLFLPVLLAVSGGLRRGEALGLTWADVAFSAGTIEVRRTITQTRDGVSEKPPKSRSSRRVFTLPAFAMAELKTVKDARDAGPEDYVCIDQNGGRVAPNDLSNEFAGFIRRHKMPHVRFHDLRHSNLSWLAVRGMDAKTIGTRAGHSSSAFTFDTYIHPIDDADKAAAVLLDRDFQASMVQSRYNNVVALADFRRRKQQARH